MNKFIEPYQYNFIENQATILMQNERSVNDRGTIETMKTISLQKIEALFPESSLEQSSLLNEITALTSTQKSLDSFLEKIKEQVVPFKVPTDIQLKKVFSKTKKLHIPKWDSLDLNNYTFYAWNDIGKQRKYLIFYKDGKLMGVQGTISADTSKGICSICHSQSNLTLFTAKTKQSADGTYTSNGNYICYNSDYCNSQLKDLAPFETFIEQVKYK